MFKTIFKKKVKKNINSQNILVAALLIHAAKMDENYTNEEIEIIKKALKELSDVSSDEIIEIIKIAEKLEEDSNQIIEFTKEIKKNSMEFRLKVIEILWKIIYSDGKADQYESNLIRRICGLLYVSDKDNGDIKLKIKNQLIK
tara:strand:+ start:754 stop:1182 length:429 start_codon:yes stop_codon:yes gene_type:complete